jgi:hypothetical protein
LHQLDADDIGARVLLFLRAAYTLGNTSIYHRLHSR